MAHWAGEVLKNVLTITKQSNNNNSNNSFNYKLINLKFVWQLVCLRIEQSRSGNANCNHGLVAWPRGMKFVVRNVYADQDSHKSSRHHKAALSKWATGTAGVGSLILGGLVV